MPTSGDTSSFSLLHPAIQRELYRMRWTQLRPIQSTAIRELLQGDKQLLICAHTAGGKTEAAFLPILSRIVGDFREGIHALYVGPLKALINDQFRRLEELCKRTEIPVHRWHGDVGPGKKHSLVERPEGVLLITPESIESLFINRSEHLTRIFGKLDYIVIDELHSFIGTERGAHLLSLLSRLRRKSSREVRVIGLSATIGSPDEVESWLLPNTPGRLQVIKDSGPGRDVCFELRGYQFNVENPPKVGEEIVGKSREADEERFDHDLFTCFYGKTALVFANSRQLVETTADRAKEICRRSGRPDVFFVHHGSLSKSVREDAEQALRSDRAVVTFCSSTLELGIDLGNVEEVGQIGSPWSVSSLVQRLGRSGRKQGESAVMRLFLVETDSGHEHGLLERLHPRLLQAIAMAELMTEGWCEPAEITRMHLSTLVQQVLSVITEHGGTRAEQLYDVLIERGAFRNVSVEMLAGVLRGMGSSDLIEQASDGTLILGLAGERVVRSFDFYSAFRSADDYRVVHQGKTIGEVSYIEGIDADRFLVLAGRRWRILDVSEERREIIVEPSRGARPPVFAGGLGADIHSRVREKMRDTLYSDDQYAYVDSHAQRMLEEARAASRAVERSFCREGEETLWFTWTGSRINRTLAMLARFGGVEVDDEGIALSFRNFDAGDIVSFYREIVARCPSPSKLASRFPIKAIEKYDRFLSEELQCDQLGVNALDLAGAIRLVQSALGTV